MKSLKESLIKSYDTEKLINKIKKKYPNVDIEKHESKSEEYTFIIYFDNKEDYDDFSTDIYIQRQFDFFGYYVTESSPKNLYFAIEPNFGTKCTDFVYNECNGLIFHVTDKDTYLKKIKYHGLKPKFGNIRKYRYFNERVFLICGKSTNEIIDNIKLIIKQKGYSKDTCIILMVDLKENHYNIDFYYDPSEDNWHNCIYCNAYFPYSYITKIRNITDIETNIDENLQVAKAPWQQT